MLLQIALSFVGGMTPQLARRIPESGLTLEDFFEADNHSLSMALGLASGETIDRMARDEARFRAEKEMEFISRHNIRAYSILSDDYPWRLADIDKAPVVLYKLGDADLDASKMISVVGTRRATLYGTGYVRQLVEGLSPYFPELTVVSGLALGIDTAAHEAALSSSLPTVAVVAHGLNSIYPASNRDLARRIVASGGAILSEYPFGEHPYRRRFLERNRIVATMTDAVLVAESAIKGGAMSTAAVASSYGREVLALPGRLGDEMSAGCNLLIRSQKASMAGDAADVMATLGWQPETLGVNVRQRNLFPELKGDEKMVYDVLRFSAEPVPLDALCARTGLPVHQMMSVLGEMEFDGIVERHPGNRYSVMAY